MRDFEIGLVSGVIEKVMMKKIYIEFTVIFRPGFKIVDKELKKIFKSGIIKSISTHKYTSKTGGAISIL